MPNSNDAAKRMRQNEKRRVRNKAVRTRVRTSIRKFEEAVKGQNKDEAQKNYSEFVVLIDKATSKGIYHKNMAARKKSRLSKVLASI